MKKSEFKEGLVVGVVPGSGKSDRRAMSAEKAEVLEWGLRRSYSHVHDGVRVRYSGEPPAKQSRYARGRGEKQPDGTFVVPSAQIWRPWNEVETHLAEEMQKEADREEANQAIADRLERVKKALIAAGFDEDEPRFSGPYWSARRTPQGEGDRITIDTTTLEALLDVFPTVAEMQD